ncbi:chemotaxis protein CheY [Terribacillus saccharophilus]|uniref:Chemotaxis protein CheY n=1 Tax=Terribacillus saccharophilus TaxID=361277 RepID=A0A075LJS5_9BACI|nr:chemotaxis protein CheC [Terribacillus goriensis]AIF66396.1 chemotaxis protein CheY [Terribacillus goriensis]
MYDLRNITEDQLDALKEAGNIGAGNAATALSTLLRQDIDMKVPAVRICHFNELIESIGGAELPLAAIYLRVQGDAPGNMFFLLQPAEAELFVHYITGNESFSWSNTSHDDINLSALHEMGNILAGSYLSAISDFAKVNMQPSVPQISVDMGGAILANGLIEIAEESDYTVVIDTVIALNDPNQQQHMVEGKFLLLLHPEAFGHLFRALGVEEDD